MKSESDKALNEMGKAVGKIVGEIGRESLKQMFGQPNAKTIPTHQQFLEEEEKLQIEKRAKWDSEQAEKNRARNAKHGSANGSAKTSDA